MQIQGDRNIFGMKNNIDIKARAMSFLKFVIYRFFDDRYFDRYKIVHCGSDLHCLKNNDVEHLFMFVGHLYMLFREIPI